MCLTFVLNGLHRVSACNCCYAVIRDEPRIERSSPSSRLRRVSSVLSVFALAAVPDSRLTRLRKAAFWDILTELRMYFISALLAAGYAAMSAH